MAISIRRIGAVMAIRSDLMEGGSEILSVCAPAIAMIM